MPPAVAQRDAAQLQPRRPDRPELRQQFCEDDRCSDAPVTGKSGLKFDSGNLNPGAVYALKPGGAGKITYSRPDIDVTEPEGAERPPTQEQPEAEADQ